jgi:polar amino acid transport system substrate-binding protein
MLDWFEASQSARAERDEGMTRIGGLITALIGMALASFAYADETIAVDIANPPYTYSKNDQARGIYPAILRAAFARMGEPVTVIPYPWKRALSLADQNAAGVAGLYANPDRLSRYDYSDPIMIEPIDVYVASDAMFPFATISDLSGKTIGVALGWSYGAEFDAARAKGLFRVEENMTDELNFGKLAVHRLDAVLAAKLSGELVAAKLKLTGKIIHLPISLSNQSTYLAFNKSADKRDLLKRFNKALDELRRDGSFDRLVAAAIAE